MADARYGVLGSLDVTRAMLAQTHGIHLPDLHPDSRLGGSVEGDESASSAVAAVAYSIPSGAGDLNGDGLDDVVVYTSDEESGLTTVRALDGRDGSELWRRAPAHWDDGLAMPVADVTGDGRSDLFRVGVAVVNEEEAVIAHCPEDGGEDCDPGYRQSFRWTYGVVSGADGVDLWTQTIDGTRSESFESASSDGVTESSSSWEWRTESVNDWIGIAPAGDHDGDGARDVLLNAVSSTYRSYDSSKRELVVMHEDERGTTLRSSTDAKVLSGASGAVIVARTVEDVPGFGWLDAAPQLVGDPTPDLLWDSFERTDWVRRCRYTNAVVTTFGATCTGGVQEYRHVVAVIDGATLTETWNSSWSTGYGFAMIVPDVSGDDVADVMSVWFAWEEGGVETRMLSGATGVEVWRIPRMPIEIGNDFILVATVDDGYGGEYGGRAEGDRGPVSVNIERRHRATGEIAFTRTIDSDLAVNSPDNVSAWVWVTNGGVVLNHREVAFGDREVTERATRIVVEDADAGTVANRLYDDLRAVYPFADLDGEGGTDVVELHIDFAYDDEWDWFEAKWTDVAMRRLVDDSLLWTIPDGVHVTHAGNQDGLPGDEVLASVYVEDVLTEIASLDGATGTKRWSITP